MGGFKEILSKVSSEKRKRAAEQREILRQAEKQNKDENEQLKNQYRNRLEFAEIERSQASKEVEEKLEKARQLLEKTGARKALEDIRWNVWRTGKIIYSPGFKDIKILPSEKPYEDPFRVIQGISLPSVELVFEKRFKYNPHNIVYGMDVHFFGPMMKSKVKFHTAKKISWDTAVAKATLSVGVYENLGETGILISRSNNSKATLAPYFDHGRMVIRHKDLVDNYVPGFNEILEDPSNHSLKGSLLRNGIFIKAATPSISQATIEALEGIVYQDANHEQLPKQFVRAVSRAIQED